MNRFKDALTRRIFEGIAVKGISPGIMRKTVMKLTMVEAATEIRELATPPSNHLEKLKGDRKGQWSIRLNEKYRVCFEWDNGRSCEIELVDYH